MIEEPEDLVVRYLLAFAYNATQQFESAVWVLSSTGLPDSVINGARLGTDLEGFMTLINALYGAGELELSNELSEFWMVNHGPEDAVNVDWWVDTYTACALAVLGRDAEALQKLQRSTHSPRQAWESILRDSTCFQRFKDEAVYQATLLHFEARRRELRTRLPSTLAEYGVTL